MSALTAAQAMASGIHRVLPDAECVLVPMADGGEGTAVTIADALGGEMVEVPCHDALGRPITGTFGWVPTQRLAIIETASASGLERIAPDDRDIAVASSYGTGELIKAALDQGAERLILGLGGSATNDAGAGLFSALGVKFLDAHGAELPPGGLALQRLARIDASGLDKRFASCSMSDGMQAACDVNNPLLGPGGASAVFGPQKGATPDLVAALDSALANWAEMVRRDLHRDILGLPGGGAAGGIGAALAAFTARGKNLPDVGWSPPPAEEYSGGSRVLRPGVEIVIDAVGLRDAVRDADWVFTGEGGLDNQTRHGKTPWGVATVAAEFGKPVIAFAGKIGDDAALLLEGPIRFQAIVPIVRSITDLPTALAHGSQNLADAAEVVCRILFAGQAVSHL